MSDKTTLRVVTPVARLSYPYLFRPSQPQDGQGEAKYQCELIFEAGTDLSQLQEAAAAAAKAKWGDKIPAKLRSPFRDGEDRDGKAGYDPGTVFISARSKDQPGVVKGRDRVPCNESEIYGGCYVRASVTAFAYEHAGNKGVSFALNNVWMIREGEPFGSRVAADEEFAGVDMDADAFGADEPSWM